MLSAAYTILNTHLHRKILTLFRSFMRLHFNRFLVHYIFVICIILLRVSAVHCPLIILNCLSIIGHVCLTDDDKDNAKNNKGSLLYGELLPRGANKVRTSFIQILYVFLIFLQTFIIFLIRKVLWANSIV